MSDWLWLTILLITNGMLIYSAHLRYRFGVWDGAFNQFLPRVRRYMREYDERKALEILGPPHPGEDL